MNFLNDFSEYNHGVEIIKREINNLHIQPEKLLALGIEPTDTATYLARGIIAGNIEDSLQKSNYSLLTFITSFFDSSGKSIKPRSGDPA